MSNQPEWWRNNPEAPFATLLNGVEAHCHPEAYDEAYDELIERARNSKGDDLMRRFKDELRAAIADPAQIPGDALFEAAGFSDGSDEKFLRRLWRDLYGDEPLTPPERDARPT